MLVNTAYAHLAEKADAADRVAVPMYHVNQVEAKVIVELSQRKALDDWLDAPFGKAAEAEAALLKYLKE